MSHTRALCNSQRVLLECAALEALDLRLFRHPLACSWRSLSMRSSTAAVARSLYIRESAAARARALGCHCSWFLLSRCASRLRRVSSLLSTLLFLFLLLRLPQLSLRPSSPLLPLLSSLLGFFSAQHSHLFCTVSAFCSGLCSRLCSSRSSGL